MKAFNDLWAKHRLSFSSINDVAKTAMQIGFEAGLAAASVETPVIWESNWMPFPAVKPALFEQVVVKSVHNLLTVDWLEPIAGHELFGEEFGKAAYWMTLSEFEQHAPPVLLEHLNRPSAESLKERERRELAYTGVAEEVSDDQEISEPAPPPATVPPRYQEGEYRFPSEIGLRNKSGRTVRCRHGVADLNHCNECD